MGQYTIQFKLSDNLPHQSYRFLIIYKGCDFM
ncbi:hypothetical protein [Enterocloster phage PMBT24]|uniref:Uncharacterized protein n=1 Tax=Enterocloster phage PMBT24 TaxID=3025413 RepID=A0AAT9TR49_9CAUD|nr:hypothetical protein [Enterocloster phage PMBT24]